MSKATSLETRTLHEQDSLPESDITLHITYRTNSMYWDR